MKNLSDPVANGRFVNCIKAAKNCEQVIEEFPANEVIVHKTVLLFGLATVSADANIVEWRVQTRTPPDLGIDPDIEVAVNDSRGSEVPADFEKRVLRVRFQQNTPFAG